VSELERQVDQARDSLQVDLSAADTSQALLRFEGRRRRRQRRRVAAGGIVTGAALALLTVAFWPSSEPKSPRPALVDLPPLEEVESTDDAPVRFATDDETPKRTVAFVDGSMAVLVRPDTQLRLEALEPELLELSLNSGEARFTVAKNPQRLFRVRTADLRIEVLGTRFSVSAPRAGRSAVKVHEGRVAVFRGTDRYELSPGMRLTWDGGRVVIDDASKDKRRTRPKKRRRRARRSAHSAPAQAAQPWTTLAENGAFDDAYHAMQDEPRRPSSPAELMLAADVARLSGHPREATTYLRRVVKEHQDRPQGMLAAFTLGRILQRELNEPRAAAQAFRTARTLAPNGSLAEDALANEAECWARAGSNSQAKELAHRYLRQYPAGRKTGSMRRLVGPSP